jgi:hypothetical protein
MVMVPSSEIYKGIEFIRISSLPDDERKLFWKSFEQEKIIKILKPDALLNDCVLLQDYTNWTKRNLIQANMSQLRNLTHYPLLLTQPSPIPQ